MLKKNCLILLLAFLLFFVGCASSAKELGNRYSSSVFNDESNEDYLDLNENNFVSTKNNNKVNISMDSSTAAYSNVRRLINSNSNVPKDAVNIEQMINYFNYSYKNETNESLAIFTEISNCPWNNNKLLQVTIKAKDVIIEERVENNFVFLLDVSGSMYSENKLPLMIEAFKLLINNLNDEDRISIVTYAGEEEVLLDGGFGYEKTKISAIISDLEASGSTHGSQGIKTAYDIAKKHYIAGGNNRVFLATDGDFNVGISDINELESFISKKRETGIFLSLFGFGSGNLKSNIMDTLASKGNGNYYYIDSILEAQKVFISELGGVLNTVAKDTKAQINFNENIVDKYRLIGYENKQLTNEEFEDSETDAGEIGASHTTICLIELILKEDYEADNILTCTLRYKDPNTDMNKEIKKDLDSISLEPSNDFIFASSVVEFALLLRDSDYKGDASYQEVYNRINKEEFKNDPFKKEFLELIVKVIQNK